MLKTSNSHLYEYGRLCASKPSLSYDYTRDFSAWQSEARERLTQLLGLPLEKCDPALGAPKNERDERTGVNYFASDASGKHRFVIKMRENDYYEKQINSGLARE